ncbi:MAG: response regulator [Chloroflexi bacterium]|nr:response regulator [Chloroflexota bacterium]
MASLHALIIDDNPTNTDVLAQLLEYEGVSSTVIQDPNDLTYHPSFAEQADVIFLDLEMPQIDGYQMLGFLRDDLGVNVPIVAYTVHTSEINTARELGFHSFLGKPLQPRLFSGQLARILNGERVWEVP